MSSPLTIVLIRDLKRAGQLLIMFIVAYFLSLEAPEVAWSPNNMGTSSVLESAYASDFTLKDTDGKDVKLSDLASRGPVLLVFWTACCNKGPDALAYASEIYKEKKDKGLGVLAVNLDGTGRHGFIRELVATYKWEFPVLLDPTRSVATQYRVLAVPSFIIVNKDMELTYYGLGFNDDQKKAVRSELDKLLK